MAGGLPVQNTSQPVKHVDQVAGEAFGVGELKNIASAVHSKYASVANSAEGMFRYPTGREGAVKLGYDEAIVAEMPVESLNSFCGVGNPHAIAPVVEGAHVLDVGCGAGFDLVVARKTVGGSGRVCGIDMTPEMLERARKNFSELGVDDIELELVDSEKIPYPDETFDVVISNGVINLSPAKLALFREIRRVLKPGGRLQFADIVLAQPLPAAMKGNLDAWAQ